MGFMWSSKISMLSSEVAAAMNAMENRLDARIQSEREERKKENEETNQKFSEVMEQIKTLEMTNSSARNAGANAGSTTNCAPQHVVFGGWPPRTKREATQADDDKMWLMVPAEPRQRCVKPYVPSAYGSIAKLRAPTTLLDQPSFDSQKSLSQNTCDEGGGPRWAAVERSPEAGARKRR